MLIAGGILLVLDFVSSLVYRNFKKALAVALRVALAVHTHTMMVEIWQFRLDYWKQAVLDADLLTALDLGGVTAIYY